MKKIITGACVLLVTVMFSPAMAQDRPTDRMDRQGDRNNDRMDRKRNPNDQRVGRQDHRPDRRWNRKIQGGDLRMESGATMFGPLCQAKGSSRQSDVFPE